jgi:hypothetical protein
MCVDVQDCPAGFICDYMEIYLAGGARAFARMCTPDPGSMLDCQHNDDCPEQEVCGLVLNPWGTGLDGQCMPAGQGGGPGESCVGGQDCRNGFCPTDGICTELCISDPDCPADFVCATVRVAIWEGASFQVPACVQVPLGEMGDPCPDGAADCVSGVCYHPEQGDAYCSAECTTDEDCSSQAEGFVCLDEGGTTSYCVFVP